MLAQIFAGLAREQRLGVAALAVGLTGGAWALLCLVLALAGHAPSVTLLPIAPAHYYAWQAAFVVPVLLAQWIATAAIVQRLTRSAAPFRAMASALGPALALPLLLVFLLPDAVVYAFVGFEALGVVVRATGPAMLLTSVALATVATRAATGVSTRRALMAAVLGVLVPAAMSGILLR